MENKSKKARRQHSLEFKKEATELAKKVGNAQAARDLGLNESVIRAWRSKFNPASSASETKSYAELEKENKRLNKENYYLKEINEVLKKSTAIFSVDHLEDLK